MLRKCPIIVILGSTGTGKTKLSIEIARKFKGEVIGADSMQVYRGLDIVTAKAPKQERALAKHHLLDVAQPGETFTVVHYKQKTLRIISDLLSKDTIPIIVGGTNYYIESILWKVLVDPPCNKNLDAPRPSLNESEKKNAKKRHLDQEEERLENTAKSSKQEDVYSKVCDDIELATSIPKSQDDIKILDTDNTQKGLSDVQGSKNVNSVDKLNNSSLTLEDEAKWEYMTGPELHEILKNVDPASATRLHPNNKRKIMRSLQIFLHTGRTHTDVLADQRNPNKGGCAIGGPLRFQNVILIWLKCEQSILDARLDSRVDSMMDEGLIEELQQFRDLYLRSSDKNFIYVLGFSTPDYTLGILQTIGLKELTPYLEYIEQNEEINETHKAKLLKECLDNLKLVTRRYARKQNRWVQNRFLGYKDRQVPSLYGLDTSKPSHWNEMVRDPAFNIIENYLLEKDPDMKPLETKPNPSVADDLNPETTHYCDVCERIFIGDFQWQLHIKSNKHARISKSKQKRMKLESQEQNQKKEIDTN